MSPTEPIWKSYIIETTEPIFTPQQCHGYRQRHEFKKRNGCGGYE